METSRFDIWVQDCMSRILPFQKVPDDMKKKIYLQAAGNETACFQIGMCGVRSRLLHLKVIPTDIKSLEGAVIPKENIDILYAELVPVHWNSWGSPPEDLEGIAPGFFPDPLLRSPWRGAWGNKVLFSIWVRIKIEPSFAPGKYRGRVALINEGEKKQVDFTIEILPFSLPKESHFLMSNWLFIEPILQFHRIKPFTHEFWKIVEIYAKNLSSHRQNVIMTPLFAINHRKAESESARQLIDITENSPGKYSFKFQNFDRWTNIFFNNGFQLIEGIPLASSSVNPAVVLIKKHGKNQVEKHKFSSTLDRDYRNFLKQYLLALRNHLSRKGWLDKFCLHISDEPKAEELETYTGLARLVKTISPEFKIIDALSTPDLKKFVKYMDYPVPLENRYEQILHESGIPKERIWFYYCNGPVGAWPNRYMDYLLIRVRIFTWLAFKYNARGFLHWGLNHWTWHPPYYREETYNPYDNTTGGRLQAGDSYVLYPPCMPSKSHEPVDSIRWEIIRKAMEDYEYLYLLRELLEKGNGTAKLIKHGNELMKEFEEKIVPGFTNHTRDAAYLEDFRSRMAKLIVKLQQEADRQ